ncbi:very short patch repair endonuclease [Patescibacteria group bacterium]|nr:very short patch repair endonuclease [Patescibacteria group bacterium]
MTKLRKGRVGKNKDIFTPEKRSEIMSAVKAKNTGFEKKFFSLLRKNGIRFQTHYKRAYGNPDIAFPSKKIAIFLDSDFWHGWRYPSWSHKLTSDFWINKIEANRKRDKKVTRKLRKDGWTVLRIWEHQIKKDPEESLDKICELVNKGF